MWQRRVVDIIADKYAAMTNQQRLTEVEKKYPPSELEGMDAEDVVYIEDDIVRIFINKKGDLIFAEYVSSSVL